MNRPLTQSQIALLKKSFRQLDADQFATRFYNRLFESHPEVRPLFSKEMDDQKTKLMSVFELVIYSFEEKNYGEFELHDSLILPLRHLGKLHEEKGIIPDHYIIANNLLLETLEFCLGVNSNQDIKEAWTLALGHLTHAMLNENVKVSTPKKEIGNTIRDTFKVIIEKMRG